MCVRVCTYLGACMCACSYVCVRLYVRVCVHVCVRFGGMSECKGCTTKWAKQIKEPYPDGVRIVAPGKWIKGSHLVPS